MRRGGEAVQDDAHDAVLCLRGRPAVAGAEVHVGPRDRVEGDVRGGDHVVAGRERAVGFALAQELDERVEVVGRLSGRRLLVKGLVRCKHQRQVPLEQAAEGGEPALETIAARPAARQDRVHRLAEVTRQLADERFDQKRHGQALPPQGGARPPHDLGHALERQPLPATLAQDGDRRLPKRLVDSCLPLLHRRWFIHATSMLHDLELERKHKEASGGPGLATIVREWGRIGCVGFGGPPAHIALLRQLCVERRRWLEAREFEDAIAACNLLPGPASTQLAIFCAWRLRGRVGALVGGACFILPGLILILALAALFLEGSPPDWVRGAGAGAGAAVAAVAVQAASSLVPDSRRRARNHLRWLAYLAAGGVAAATIGPWLVLVLLGCGLLELATRRAGRPEGGTPFPLLAAAAGASGGLLALVWVA